MPWGRRQPKAVEAGRAPWGAGGRSCRSRRRRPGSTTGAAGLDLRVRELHRPTGAYIDDTMNDVESAVVRPSDPRAEAPFVYESTAAAHRDRSRACRRHAGPRSGARRSLRTCPARPLGRHARPRSTGVRPVRQERVGGLPTVRARPRRRAQRLAVRRDGVQLDEGVRHGRRRLAGRRRRPLDHRADAQRPAVRATFLRLFTEVALF